MTYQFLIALLATLARALTAHACGEALRFTLEYLAPNMPPLICIVIGLVLGIALIEIAVTVWRRRDGRPDPP
jgi:hypothetical protein